MAVEDSLFRYLRLCFVVLYVGDYVLYVSNHALPVLPLEHTHQNDFFPHTVEVVEDTKPFVRFKLRALAAKSAKMNNQICAHTGKVSTGVRHILFVYRDCHILILHDGICPGSLLKQHFVVFLTVLVQLIARLWNQDRSLKVQPVQAAVVDCDFCRCAGIKRIKQL